MRGSITVLLTACMILSGLSIPDHSGGTGHLDTVDISTRGDDNNTLYVGPGQDYTTIQSAINAADWWDTIRIFNGTYNERITIDKPLWIEGNSTEGVIINGNGQGEVIVITHYGVNLKRVTVEGGRIEKDGDVFFAVRVNHMNSTAYIDDIDFSDMVVRNSMGGIGVFKSGSLYMTNVLMINNTQGGLIASETKARVNNCRSTLNGLGFVFPSSSGVKLLASNASYNAGVGVAMGDHVISSYNNEIRDCEIIENGENGINIQGYDIEIINNTIRDNAWDSIYISFNSHDIRIMNNRMINNSHYFNTENIELWKDSTDISIVGNWIEGSSRYAIHMHDTGGSPPASYGNLIYYNNFIDNGRDGIQAYDVSGQNRWNSSDHGNYWSDWTSPDTDSDGIVDTPYSTAGKGKDYLPSTKPLVSPLILNKDAPDSVVNSSIYWYIPEVVDPDDYPSDLIWSLSTNASWLEIDDKNRITGRPNVRTGVYFANLTISDGNNIDFYNFTVNVPLFNSEPEIFRISGNTIGKQYGEIDQQFFVYDANSDDTSFEFNIGRKIHIPWGGEYNETEEQYEGYEVVDLKDQLPYHDMKKDVNWGYEVEYFEMREYSIKFWMDLSDQNIWHTDNGSVNSIDIDLAIKVWDDYGGVNATKVKWTLKDVNDPPVISGKDYLKAYVNNTYIANFDAADVDSPAVNQSWSVNTNATFLSINTTSGVLSGTPTASDTGSFLVSIYITDGEGGSDWFNFTLTVTIPSENQGSLGLLKIDEDGEDGSLSIESIFYGFHLGDLSDISMQADNFTFRVDEFGAVIIIPEENWAGRRLVTFTARYGDIFLKRTLLISIDNVNDPPVNADIVLPDMKFYEDETIVGYATVFDPDLPYGEVLSIVWTVDGIGEVGTGARLNINMSLPPGTYQLRVTITDSSGETTEAVRTIQILKSVEGSKTPSWWIGALVTALAVISVILLVSGVFILNNRRKGRGSGDIEPEPAPTSTDPSPPSCPPGPVPPAGDLVSGGIIDDIPPRSYLEYNDIPIGGDIDGVQEGIVPLAENSESILEEIRTASLMGKRPSDSLPEEKDIIALAEERFEEGTISEETLLTIKEILLE
ncbi:MAG: putative Ig domain-containing protein [Thermoplasmatota archaeon]